MEKLIADIKALALRAQEAIDADKTGKTVTSELRSAAVKLGAAARSVERHVQLLARQQQAAAQAAAQARQAETAKA